MRTVLGLIGLIFLMCFKASASLTLTLSNPDQIVAAGGHAVYKGTLSNTDAVAYTVVTFTVLNPPTDATTPPTSDQLFPIAEPSVPFTIEAGGKLEGVIMDITVPATAQIKSHSFSVEAVTSSHDAAGNSIVSNPVPLSLTVVAPRPTTDHQHGFMAGLTGLQETPPIVTTGKGTFTSALNSAGTELSYTLTFSDLSSPSTVAHIHFGQSGVAGAFIAFLCGGGSAPPCPSGGGTVTGTIMASDVQAVSSQGINGGSFSDFLAVMRSGDAYVNVHSANYPAGEIRGQIRASKD